ncbi:MAG: nucleotidyltransferase [Candidatus Omnitrophota bacterium]|nr:nucleotidyltransferase [Candidatus Omnitrophota bacterium]
MPIPSDYRELLKILNRHRVKYLIVGAYAVTYYTEPRYTKDLDIWLKPEIKNATRTYKALKEFGAPLKDISVEDLTNKNLVYQIGIEPVRVDLIMNISGVKFEPVWKHRVVADFDGVKVNIMGIKELIESKKATKRRMDIVDIENLKLSKKLRKK